MKRVILALLWLYFSFAAASACCEAAEDIRLGWIGPLTGNSAAVGVDSVKAVQVAVDQANREGGVNGRKIKLLVEDDGYITQRLGGAFTVHTASGLFRIAPEDADALGQEPAETPMEAARSFDPSRIPREPRRAPGCRGIGSGRAQVHPDWRRP